MSVDVSDFCPVKLDGAAAVVFGRERGAEGAATDKRPPESLLHCLPVAAGWCDRNLSDWKAHPAADV